jgi:NTP pyrophosphatase (non-canonical NTP hydrolase)
MGCVTIVLADGDWELVGVGSKLVELVGEIVTGLTLFSTWDFVEETLACEDLLEENDPEFDFDSVGEELEDLLDVPVKVLVLVPE